MHEGQGFGRAAVNRFGDEVGFELGGAEAAAAGKRTNRADRSTADLPRQSVRAAEVRQFGRANVDRVSLRGVLPQGVFVGLGPVANARQVRREIFRAPSLPG